MVTSFSSTFKLGTSFTGASVGFSLTGAVPTVTISDTAGVVTSLEISWLLSTLPSTMY